MSTQNTESPYNVDIKVNYSYIKYEIQRFTKWTFKNGYKYTGSKNLWEDKNGKILNFEEVHSEFPEVEDYSEKN